MNTPHYCLSRGMVAHNRPGLAEWASDEYAFWIIFLQRHCWIGIGMNKMFAAIDSSIQTICMGNRMLTLVIPETGGDKPNWEFLGEAIAAMQNGLADDDK